MSRSSSSQDIGSGTSNWDTEFSLEMTSLGVEKVMPFSLAQTGRALMNSRMLEDNGCAMPSALSSMKILMTCSSCGMESIQLM